MQCEGQIERLAKMALPSLGRFAAKSQSCMATFQAKCVGPAGPAQLQRLEHAMERERARFQREYNDRLYSGLVVLTLAMAVLCRFVLKRMLLEFVCWASFLFLEVLSTSVGILACSQRNAAAKAHLVLSSQGQAPLMDTVCRRAVARASCTIFKLAQSHFVSNRFMSCDSVLQETIQDLSTEPNRQAQTRSKATRSQAKHSTAQRIDKEVLQNPSGVMKGVGTSPTRQRAKLRHSIQVRHCER